MITREAKNDDLPEITILAKQFKINTKDEDILKIFYEVINRKDHIINVCVEDNGVIVGYIHGFIRLIIGNSLSVEVGGIVVQEEYRRKGVGSLLLSQIEDWSRLNSINTITLASSNRRTNA